MDTQLWVCLLIAAGVVAAAGAATWVISAVLIRIGRRHGVPVLSQIQLCRRPLRITAMALATLIMANRCPALAGWRHAAAVVLVLATCMLVIRVVLVAELIMFNRLRMDVDQNRRVRRARTQVTLLRRLSVVVIVLLGAAGTLMIFPQMHTFGASLFASAGVAGIVAGLAAQTTLANMFAGLQLVFTDAVRIDDVVVVEDEWGWIEEITLTYVVVHLWDERRLVLPTNYFTSKPFQNWTRNEARVLGAVTLYLDYATPLSVLRERAREVVEASILWDRQDWVLQVIDTTEHTIVVRVLASAVDGPTAWDLRCEIREELVSFLQEQHPQSLPVHRIVTLPDHPTDLRHDHAPVLVGSFGSPAAGPRWDIDQDELERVGNLERVDLDRVEPDRLDVDRVEQDQVDADRVRIECKPTLIRRADLRREQKISAASGAGTSLPATGRGVHRLPGPALAATISPSCRPVEA